MPQGKIRRVTALGRFTSKPFRWDRSLSGTEDLMCLTNLKIFQSFFKNKYSESMAALHKKVETLTGELEALNVRISENEELAKASETLARFEEMAEEKGWGEEEFRDKRDRLFKASKMISFVAVGREIEVLEADIARLEAGIQRAEEFYSRLTSESFGNISAPIKKDLSSEVSAPVKAERPSLVTKLKAFTQENDGNIVGLSQLFDLFMRRDDRLPETWRALIKVERNVAKAITKFVTEHYALIDDEETGRAHLSFELNQIEKAFNSMSLGEDVEQVYDEEYYNYLLDEEEQREETLLGVEGRRDELLAVLSLIKGRESKGKRIDQEYKQAVKDRIAGYVAQVTCETFIPTLGLRDEFSEYTLLVGPVYKAYVELRRNVMRLLFPGSNHVIATRYSETETQQMREEIQNDLEEARRNWKEAKVEKESAEKQIQTARAVWEKTKKKEELVDSRITEAQKALKQATEREQEFQEKLTSLEEKERNMLTDMKKSKETLRQERDQLIRREKVLEEEKAQLESREKDLFEKQTVLEKRNNKLQQEQQKLTTSLSELEAKQKALTGEKEQLESEKQKLSEAYKALEAKSAKVQAECDALTRQLTERQRELDQKQGELSVKEQELVDKEAQLLLAQQEVSNLRLELGGETEELQNRRASLDGHKKDHQAAQATLEATKQKFAKLAADLITQREALDKDKAEFSQEKQAFIREQSQYKAEVEQRFQQFSQREVVLTAKSEDLAAKAQDLAKRGDLIGQVANLKAQLNVLSAENQQLKANVAVESTTAENRRLSSLGHSQEEAKLKAELVDLQAKQQAETESHAKQIAVLKEDLAKLRKENSELTNLHDHLRTAQKKLNDLQTLRGCQEKALASVQAKLAKAEADASFEAEKSSALREELDSLKGQLPRQFHKVPGRIMWVAGSASTFAFTAATLAVLTTLDTTLPAATLFANPVMSVLFALAAVSVIVAVVGGAWEMTHQCKKTSLLKAQSDSNLKNDAGRTVDVSNNQ